ncbi:hypothetical protein CgunFtcFv8_020996 [Champsocephalus gunnari]|uniref:Uncharacterized protein n=2 Tax=Champsocephalus gunnari TaxID=52237 RepID=A0AAN8ERL4_CHAGU|nr:hypothetical protein CgunFtcFv8_020996 [Champsocephalus gunnari]
MEIADTMANTMPFARVTFGQQMVTFSSLAIHGESRNSFTQVAMRRKSPSDHLPLVSATMDPTLLKCAEGGWPLCYTGGEGGQRFTTGRV